MKLEVKHLAPYLPYGLQVECRGKTTTLDALENEDGAFVGENRKMSFVYLKHIKPILRPISSMDLEEVKELQSVVKDEDVYIAVSDTDVWIEENISDPFSGHMELHVDVLYAAYEWLFKNHFDVFNLINKGLAVEKG